MTWFRRIRLYLAGIWALAALASCYSIYLARGSPDWYQQQVATDEQRLAAANQSDQKLAELISYASDVAAAQRLRYRGNAAAATIAVGPKTITFSELQINEFLKKWDALLGGAMGERFGQYVSDGRLILLDKHLLIAGTLKNISVLSNTVLSVEFVPSIDGDGRLWPMLRRVYGGRLPLPEILLQSPKRQLVQGMEGEMQDWQRHALVFPDGLVNHEAMAVEWGNMLLAAVRGTSVNSILVLPSDMGGFGPAVAVRLVDLQVSDRTISFTIRPLTDSEVQSVRADISKPNPMAIAGK
jgi:hypothetical protein